MFKKRHLRKIATTLKLEGIMEKRTENAEKFTVPVFTQRPPLCKKPTNLRMEGDIDIRTENHEKFVAHEPSRRPPLAKTSTNLHVEGDLDMQPEYRDVFVEYKYAKQRPNLPVHNLKLNGFHDVEVSNVNIHPVIPFLRERDSGKKLVLGEDKSPRYAEYKEKFVQHAKTERTATRRPEPHLKQGGDMQSVTENKSQFVEKRSPRMERRRGQTNLRLEGHVDMTPEYKKSFVDFYHDGRKSPIRRRGTLARSTTLRNEGDIEINPEYRSSYVDFPRERPSVKKPESHLINEGNVSSLINLTPVILAIS